jgi:hypothetical protein
MACVIGLSGCSNPPKSVTVSAAATTVDPNDSTTLSATVQNDSSAEGVTWTTNIGVLSQQDSTSATFTAPAATSAAQAATVTATSVANPTAFNTVSIIIPAELSVVTNGLPGDLVGTPYSQQLAASGGIPPYTWMLVSGTLPACLTMNSAGVISGTPVASCVGTATGLVFKATDSGTPNALAAISSPTELNIAPAPPIQLPPSGLLSVGIMGTPLTFSYSATGGEGTLTYSISAGALPPGLSLTAAGAITGTPTAAGTFTFTILASDAFGDSGKQSYSIQITYPPVTIAPAGGALPNAFTGSAYSQSLTAGGGSGAGFIWTVTGLPADGISFSANAGTLVISGTPTNPANVSFTASVKDGAGNTIGPFSYTIQVYNPISLPAANPPSLPANATINTAYSGTITASGGSGSGYTWTVTGLSDGLTSSNSGGTLTISGTPTTAGTVTFNVSVKDSSGSSTGPIAYTITVNSVLTLPATNPATLPGNATVGTAYSGTITASGGSGTGYVFTVTGLPSDGISYSDPAGTLTISGTPTTTGPITFNVSIKDSLGNTAGPITYTINVYNPLVLPAANPNTLPATGTVNVAYSGTIVATGGSGSGYTWTVTGLSDGLTSSTSGGTLTISGTPTSAGTVTFIASLKDSAGNSAGPITYTINVYNPLTLPATNPATLGPGIVNAAYSGTVTASGGSGSGYTWTVTGLSNGLNYTTNGATLTVSGTPTSATTVSFNASVKDSANDSAGPVAYSIQVYNTLTLPTPNPTTLGPATATSAYSGTIVVAGGSGNYTWTVTGLSDGLTSSPSGSTLTISGTPTSAATVSFNVSVKDTTTNATAGPTTYTILVSGPLALPTPDPGSLPSIGYTGVAYSGTINAAGGSGNYSWSAAGLSDNLSYTGNGGTLTISGSPTSAATVTFSVTLKDASTNASITMNGYDIVVSNPTAVGLPAPNPSSLGPATVGQSYAGFINATGGVPNYTWSINGVTVTGSGIPLANGLTATNTGGNTLSISGTPSTTTSVPLTNVMVVDSLNTNATQTYTIAVNPVSTLALTIDRVPQGMVNMPYTFDNLNISGGNGPYTITYSNLPSWVSQPSNSSSLVGIPTSPASTTVKVTVTDSTTPTAQSQSTTFALSVVPLTVAANNSELKGQYACQVEQFYDNGAIGGTGATLYRGGMAFAIAVDGNGNITGGEADSNNPVKGFESASSNGALTGTYAVGSDNRGYLLLAAPGQTPPNVFAIAGGNLDSNSHFSDFTLAEMDDVGPAPNYPFGRHGGGHCYQQNTTTPLTGIRPSGGYAFYLKGEDNQGNLESIVGSTQINGTTGVMSGVQDVVDAGVYQGEMSFTGSSTAADSWGRLTTLAGPTGQTANPSVMYLTNDAKGRAVMLSANPHNGVNNADLYIGETRAQVAAHVSAAYPLNGPVAIYVTGMAGDLTGYHAMVMQAVGSTTSTSITANTGIENYEGRIEFDASESMTYTTDPNTGRTTMSKGGSPETGTVFYIYDTNSAVILFADEDGGSGKTMNEIGWAAPQTAPSGTPVKWTPGVLSTRFFMEDFNIGDNNKDSSTGTLNIDNSGNLLNFASDDGGSSWADWDEPLSGSSTVTATAVIVPDTTLDPNGTFGVFDVNQTSGGTTQTQVYCIAISVDAATNSATKGRLVCIDASSGSPDLTLLQE